MDSRQLLISAATLATRSRNARHHFIGAIGLRSDGAMVRAVNGSAPFSNRQPRAHAETRLCRKLDAGAEVFVSRVNRTGLIRLARPCDGCLRAMVAKHVSRVYYTIDNEWFGWLSPKDEMDRKARF